MIAMNLAVQALGVILQNAHRGLRAVLWELSIVFTLLKPAIDAVRVAGGAEQVEGSLMDPLVEMVFCKCSEMTFESIPGGFAQAVFLLDGGDWTSLAVASVVLSCISTAFTVTTIDFDLDTNKAKRGKNPEFHGYIPDTAAGRIMIFTLLFVYHSAHTLGNTFSMAVLAETNWIWLVAYLLADHCGLILYKLARGDLVYWIPGLGVSLSMLIRFAVKVITDFTGYAARNLPSVSALSPVVAYAYAQTTQGLLCGRYVHFRHPLELGGIYFFVNALKSLASWFVAAALYSRYFPAATTEIGLVAGMNTSAGNYSGFLNSTGANVTGAISAFAQAFQGI
jgi:hypothetical protein